MRSSLTVRSTCIGLMTFFSTCAWTEETDLSVLHTFDVADPASGVSATGSQPDTRPTLGVDGSIYGMTYTGGVNGTGVIYRYRHGRYGVLHTFSVLDDKGANVDGAFPGVALTAGQHDEFYGMTSSGGTNGTGTLFRISASGHFAVLHIFSATDGKGFNEDGAAPLRTLIIGKDGNLYGTTRLGGQSGLGVAWVMTPWGSFSVIHQYVATEGHAASLLQARDGYLYGCGVWPLPRLGPGTLYRMDPTGSRFEVLYRFGAVDANGNNPDGADCYEPLTETAPGVFVGAASNGGPNGNGVLFRYSLSHPTVVTVLHAFSATNAAGDNADGAYPYARLTPGEDGGLYSTASYGGANGGGVIYRLKPNGAYQVLYTFSAVDRVTGSNRDGSNPDFGVVRDGDGSWIGMADYGGQGNVAGGIGNGTLYRLRLED